MHTTSIMHTSSHILLYLPPQLTLPVEVRVSRGNRRKLMPREADSRAHSSLPSFSSTVWRLPLSSGAPENTSSCDQSFHMISIDCILHAILYLFFPLFLTFLAHWMFSTLHNYIHTLACRLMYGVTITHLTGMQEVGESNPPGAHSFL